MLFSSRTLFAIMAILLSSFTRLVLSSSVNTTASYPPYSTYAPATLTTSSYTYVPTGTSNGNGTSASNSSVPVSPTSPPVTDSAASSLKEAGYGTAGLAVFLAFAVASL
ncbi:hypothetical protein PZA11_005622 [Diplocarpon coronariae]